MYIQSHTLPKHDACTLCQIIMNVTINVIVCQMLLIMSHCGSYPDSSDHSYKIPVSLVVWFRRSMHMTHFSASCPVALFFLKSSEFLVDLVLEEFYLKIWNSDICVYSTAEEESHPRRKDRQSL